MACPPAVPANDWLRPAVVLGALALLLVAFHGVRQEIKDVRQEIQGIRQEIQGIRQEIRASEESLRADNRALNEKLDRLLETLLQP